jgi:hypothetical protein
LTGISTRSNTVPSSAFTKPRRTLSFATPETRTISSVYIFFVRNTAEIFPRRAVIALLRFKYINIANIAFFIRHIQPEDIHHARACSSKMGVPRMARWTLLPKKRCMPEHNDPALRTSKRKAYTQTRVKSDFFFLFRQKIHHTIVLTGGYIAHSG